MHTKQLFAPAALLIALGVVASGSGGCQKSQAAANTSTPAPAAAPAHAEALASASAPTVTTFENKKHAVHLQYTSNWVPKKDPDYELKVIPADNTAGREITFDIPDLPPHFPGMIRLGLIENGYVGDIKDKHKNMHVDKSADYPIGQGAKARLVEVSWNQDGKDFKNVALLMMRNDHVYILACQSDAAGMPGVRADFDAVMKSLQWSK